MFFSKRLFCEPGGCETSFAKKEMFCESGVCETGCCETLCLRHGFCENAVFVNQAFAKAINLAMCRAYASEWDVQDVELEAWFSDAHGVAEVARALVVSQSGCEEKLGRHQAHGRACDQGTGIGVTKQLEQKASWACTPRRAGVSKGFA